MIANTTPDWALRALRDLFTPLCERDADYRRLRDAGYTGAAYDPELDRWVAWQNGIALGGRYTRAEAERMTQELDR